MRDEQIGINSGDILLHQTAIKELEESMKHVLERLHALEEKERARARESHQREEALDFADAEGLIPK